MSPEGHETGILDTGFRRIRCFGKGNADHEKELSELKSVYMADQEAFVFPFL